jgi:hypothetical protein
MRRIMRAPIRSSSAAFAQACASIGGAEFGAAKKCIALRNACGVRVVFDPYIGARSTTHPMKINVLDRRPEPTESDIQKAAYFLWVECGRPVGRDQEMWFAAREKLLHAPKPLASQSRVPSRASRRTSRHPLPNNPL